MHRLNKDSESIEDLLKKELASNNFPNSENFIKQSLKLGNLLLLFDGYDEVNSNQRIRVTTLIKDFIDLHDNCNCVITSRIAIYKNDFFDVVDKTFEMVEFNHQQIRMFLQSWGTGMPPGKSIDQLMITLQERPKIMMMATNPLMLTIVAYLYTDTPHKFPHSRGEFYNIATDLLLKQWHDKHNIYDARDKSLILQHLALVSQEDNNEKSDDRKLIHYTKAKDEVKKILPKLNQDIEVTTQDNDLT